MNGRRAKERRRARGPKPVPGYPVRRTTPIVERDGWKVRLICHTADDDQGRLIFTEGGRRESLPERLLENGRTVVKSKAHDRRVAAVGKRTRRKS